MLAGPDYEIKLYLRTDRAVDAGRRPVEPVRREFRLPGQPVELVMAFVDSTDRPLHAAGWNIRLRRKGDGAPELTYKKRYRLEDAAPSRRNDLRRALITAALDGFDATEHDYEAQVEWGYRQRTLTFSREPNLGALHGDPLRDDGTARELAIRELPGKLKHGGKVAERVLERAVLFGPVRGERWTGEWRGRDLDLEVWEVRGAEPRTTELLVEASFKVKEYDDALDRHMELERLLGERDWLLPQDVLKTRLILERHLPQADDRSPDR